MSIDCRFEGGIVKTYSKTVTGTFMLGGEVKKNDDH